MTDVGVVLVTCNLHPRHDVFCRLLFRLERYALRVSLAKNPTPEQLAVQRRGIMPETVWVIGSVPDLGRFMQVKARVGRAFRYLIGYVGMIAAGRCGAAGSGRWNTREAPQSNGCRLPDHRRPAGSTPAHRRTRIAADVEFAVSVSGDAVPWRLNGPVPQGFPAFRSRSYFLAAAWSGGTSEEGWS